MHHQEICVNIHKKYQTHSFTFRALIKATVTGLSVAAGVVVLTKDAMELKFVTAVQNQKVGGEKELATPTLAFDHPWRELEVAVCEGLRLVGGVRKVGTLPNVPL